MSSLFKHYVIFSVSVHTINISTSGSPVAGQMYTLTCTGRIVGDTSLIPVVTWRNSNGVVTNGNDITVSNGVLTFNPLHTSHGGQYTCQSTLSSPISSMTATINITVQSKYFTFQYRAFNIVSHPSVPPPTVTITSTPITTSYYAGTPLNLTCTVQLIPQVDINVAVTPVWFRGGSSNITINNYTTISPMIGSSSYVTTLIFNPLGTADSGRYNCNVSVHPGAPYVISGVGGGSLFLQVLGQWYQHTPFILIISASSSISSSCSQCHHHSFPPSSISWCCILPNMSGHGGGWSSLTYCSELDQS